MCIFLYCITYTINLFSTVVEVILNPTSLFKTSYMSWVLLSTFFIVACPRSILIGVGIARNSMLKIWKKFTSWHEIVTMKFGCWANFEDYKANLGNMNTTSEADTLSHLCWVVGRCDKGLSYWNCSLRQTMLKFVKKDLFLFVLLIILSFLTFAKGK